MTDWERIDSNASPQPTINNNFLMPADGIRYSYNKRWARRRGLPRCVVPVWFRYAKLFRWNLRRRPCKTRCQIKCCVVIVWRWVSSVDIDLGGVRNKLLNFQVIFMGYVYDTDQTQIARPGTKLIKIHTHDADTTLSVWMVNRCGAPRSG